MSGALVAVSADQIYLENHNRYNARHQVVMATLLKAIIKLHPTDLLRRTT